MSNISITSMEDKRAKILGLNIRAERRRKDLSQEKLAELANMSLSSIGFVERGQQNISALNLIAIAKALNIDINDLIKDV